MSRYLLLFLVNLPFVLAGIISIITQYKLGRASRRRFIAQLLLWIVVLAGLIFAEPLYTWLFKNDLTRTEPLSLFDVVQITAIVVVYYIASRSRSKLEVVERRLQDLHQELSIVLSERKK